MGKVGAALVGRVGFLLTLSLCLDAEGARVKNRRSDPKTFVDAFPQPTNEPLRPIRFRNELGWLAEIYQLETGAEIGQSMKSGPITEFTLQKWKRAKKYHIIGEGDMGEREKLPSVSVVSKSSLKAAEDFGERSLDFVYLCVSKETAAEEIRTWWGKVSAGGMFAGLYTSSSRDAVENFFSSIGRQVSVTYKDKPETKISPSFIIMKPGGKLNIPSGASPHVKKWDSRKAMPEVSRQLKDGPLLPIRSRAGLSALCNTLGLKTGLEIGVQRGKFSKIMLTDWKSVENYYCLDAWAHQKNYHEKANADQATQNVLMAETKHRLSRWVHRNQVQLVKGFSNEKNDMWEDGSLDFVYVDARHDYKGVTEDLELYWPKVRPGGIFAGHDFVDAFDMPGNQNWSISIDGTFSGDKAVRASVVEFAGKIGRQVAVTYDDNSFASFVIKK